jgi:hypothetical protein
MEGNAIEHFKKFKLIVNHKAKLSVQKQNPVWG